MGNFSATLAKFPISLEEADIVDGFDEHPFINTLRVIASQVCHQKILLLFFIYFIYTYFLYSSLKKMTFSFQCLQTMLVLVIKRYNHLYLQMVGPSIQFWSFVNFRFIFCCFTFCVHFKRQLKKLQSHHRMRRSLFSMGHWEEQNLHWSTSVRAFVLLVSKNI